MNHLHILYEDADLLVCEKPAGMPVQTKALGVMDLESMLKNHLKQQNPSGTDVYLAVIHRLDQPVRGILVFAKTRSAAAKLNAQMQSDGFGKYYQAVLCGTLSPETGTLHDYLIKDGRTNRSRIAAKGEANSKSAALSYQILRTNAEQTRSVAAIKLQTGRHHQIRVQMANAGAPLWGDNKYNPAFIDKKGYFPIALCAYRLEFIHPTTGIPLTFELECNWTQC